MGGSPQVLVAVGMKWDFSKFMLGLVGGSCIGLDPFYLVQQAKQIGYHLEFLWQAVVLYDSMGKHVASEVKN